MGHEIRKDFVVHSELETSWEIREGKIRYGLQPTKEQPLGEMELLLIDRNGMDAWAQALTVVTKEKGKLWVEADFNPVLEEAFPSTAIKFKTYIRTMVQGELYIYRLATQKIKKAFKEGSEQCYFVYQEPEKILGSLPGGYEAGVYYTVFGRMGIQVYEKQDRYLTRVINKLTKVTIKKKQLKISFSYQDIKDCQPEAVTIKLRHSKDLEDVCFTMPIKTIKKEGKWTKAEAQLDLSRCTLRALYWDVYLEYRGKDGVTYPTKIKNYNEAFKNKQFRSFFKDNTYYFGKNEMFYPYLTTADALAFQCREKGEYDDWQFRLKERVAAGVYFLLKPYWIHKGIYLVYEKFCMMAQDNGYYFFKYCMENDIEKKLGRKIYYVIDKNSPDMEKLLPYKKNLIEFMSVRYIVYMLASKLLISTDTRSHGYAWRSKNSIMTRYLKSKKLVFLQHGVTALKKVDFLYGKGHYGDCNLFVVTSDYEKDIVLKNFGYREDEIAVSGFARWDVLEDKSEGNRDILLMPTWRNWLEEVGDEVFKQSDYYQNYMKFLTSPRLASILEKKDLKLNFYLHPKFRDYINEFKIDAERIRLIPFGQEPLNELMMKCRMLITDYSSVCWDMYYQGKPVIFYQFDLEDYYELHGSYMDMRKDLFGPQVEQLEDVFDAFEKMVEADFKLEPKYEEMRHFYYKHIDDKNSQRICDAVVEKGW